MAGSFHFLLASGMKDIEIFIMLFTGSKNIDCHEDMSLRIWYFIRVNRVFLGILIFIFQNLSPRLFMIFTRGFRRHKGDAKNIAKNIAKKTFFSDF